MSTGPFLGHRGGGVTLVDDDLASAARRLLLLRGELDDVGRGLGLLLGAPAAAPSLLRHAVLSRSGVRRLPARRPLDVLVGFVDVRVVDFRLVVFFAVASLLRERRLPGFFRPWFRGPRSVKVSRGRSVTDAPSHGSCILRAAGTGSDYLFGITRDPLFGRGTLWHSFPVRGGRTVRLFTPHLGESFAAGRDHLAVHELVLRLVADLPTRVDDQPLEVELRDGGEAREVVLARLVDHLHEGAAAVEVLEDVVDLVGDLGEALHQLGVVDLEDRGQRRELLEHAAPLVDAAHALHEQALGARGDGARLDADGAELEVEVAVVPDQEAVHRRLAAELVQLGVDQVAFVEVDGAASALVAEVEHAGLAADVDRLEQVDEAHLRERAAEARLGHAAALEALALVALQDEVHPRDDLFDVDRLGQVVLDAQLEAPDLALHRAVAREEDEGDLLGGLPLAELLDEGEAVHLREDRVREDEVRRGEVGHLERLFPRVAGGDGVAGLPQAHLQDAKASRVRVDEEEVLLGHGGRVGARVVRPGRGWDAPKRGILGAGEGSRWVSRTSRDCTASPARAVTRRDQSGKGRFRVSRERRTGAGSRSRGARAA